MSRSLLNYVAADVAGMNVMRPYFNGASVSLVLDSRIVLERKKLASRTMFFVVRAGPGNLHSAISGVSA